MKTFLTEGNWGHSNFEAYLDTSGNFEPLRSMTSGVVSICFTPKDKIVLTQRKDGNWDLLGGHLEKGESVENALTREALEEAGMKLTGWKYFGHYLIKQAPDAPKAYKDKYPKRAYILFFTADGKKVDAASGKEIRGSKEFSIEELRNSDILHHVMLDEAIKLHKTGF